MKVFASAAAISAVALASVLGLSGPANAVATEDAPTLMVSGQLVVVADGGADLTHESDAAPLTDAVSYSVITDDGRLVAIDAELPPSAQTGDRFEGTVVIPDDVAASLSVDSGASIDVDSALGSDVVDAAEKVDAPLVVDASEVIDLPVDASVTPGAHTIDVAVVSAAMTTSAVSALTATVGAYWVNELDGGISSFTQPLVATTSLTSACPTTESTYNSVWSAAAATFGRSPSYYTNGGGHHLVVILPAACGAAGSTGTGLGTIGSSVHQGGLNFVSNESDVAVTTLAHEIGHNLGLGHGNLSYCGTSSFDEGSGCTVYEYNDVYSIMGYALEGWGNTLPALPAPQRDFLKGYSTGEITTQVPSPSAPLSKMTYTLKPASDSSGLRAISVTDPFTGLTYYVELRSGSGADASAFYTNGYIWNLNGDPNRDVIGTGTGVRVLQLDASRLDAKGAMSTAFSVVTNPGAPTTAFAALYPNEEFTARSGGVRVHVDALLPNSDSPTSATVTITTGGWTGSNAPPAVSRIAGANRFETSAAIAATYTSADTVYIANGFNYPDALSAAPAAALRSAPLLLTDPHSLPSAIANQVQRLHPDHIYVVGGAAVVSDAVLAALENLYGGQQVVRLAGANRYETSRDLTRDAFEGDPTPTPIAFIATGLNFPDALSASAAAGLKDAPVILVSGTANSVDTETLALLDDLGVTKIYIAGGTGVVSSGIQSQLSAKLGSANVKRLAGTDRYSTSVAINALFAGGTSSAYVAAGTGFADALSGAALAGMNGAPLYVAPGTCVPPPALTQLDSLALNNVTLLGGTAVLTTNVQNLRSC